MSASAESKVALEARITQVTVYEDRARVVRRTEVELTPGRRVLSVTGLTAALETGSLRARIDRVDGARVVGVTAGWEARPTPSREEEAELRDRVEELERQRALLDDRMSLVGASSHLIGNYGELAREAVGRHAATGEIPPARWGAALTFLGERSAEVSDEQRELASSIRDLDRELRARRAELERLKAPRDRRTRFVEVTVQAGAAGTAELTVEYTVRRTGWSPAYDVRAHGEVLELTAYATVSQGTGEDWVDVELALSTARPGQAARIPELTPLLLSGHARVKQPVTIVSYGTERRDEQAPSEPPPPQAGGGGAPTPPGRVRAEDSETAVRFVVDGAETVPADRRPHRVELMRIPLEAELSFETLPKLAPFVHRKATCRNPAEVPLLAGPLDVFRASGFVGSGSLDHVAPGQEFSVSLGTEEELGVRRIIDEKVDSKPRLLGSKRTLTHAYRIELTNRTDPPVSVTLVENIPVSQRDEIEVDLGKDTRPDDRDDDGILRWDVALEPGQKREIPFAFSISYPKDWTLAGI